MKQNFTPAAPRDPVADMMSVLYQTGHADHETGSPWENCLCAALLTLEPSCKTYRLLESMPYGKHGLDETGLLNTLAHLGYFARHTRQALRDIDPRLLPALFIDNNGRPSVVIEKSDETARLYMDSGIVTVNMAKGGSTMGTCWFFEKYDENRSAMSKFMRAGSGKSWFRAVLSRFKGTLIQVLVSGLMINLIALGTPLFIILIYGRVIASGSADTLPMLALGMAITIVLEFFFRRSRSKALSWLAARMDNIVGNRIFAHLVGLPAELIERASVAAQIARIKTFESVRDFFSGSVFLSMMEIPYVVLALLAMTAVAGKLVLVPLLIGCAYIGLFMMVHRKVKVVIRLAAKASSARQQFTIESFEKLRSIRSQGLTRLWQKKFRELSGHEMAAHFQLNWLGMVAETCAHTLTLMAAVLTIGLGVLMIWSGSMGTGALVASMILVWRILTPFYSMCTMIPRLEQLRNSIVQVNTLMDIDTEAMQGKTASRLPRMRGGIDFSHVTFRYNEKADPVLKGFTMTVKPGDTVIVTGENGSGKSTLLKLLKSLYKVSEGSLLIDGFDIRQLDAPDLRRQIAYVPQNPDFYNGTIIENMRVGNPLATEEDIMNALDMADARADIEALSDGIHTVIGRYGSTALQSGLQTKLSLARAYLHPAQIMLIDEIPNTLLSGRLGKNLREYMISIKGRRTCIMVSYREDFMRIADTVAVLKRGEPAQIGVHKDIIQKLTEAA